MDLRTGWPGLADSPLAWPFDPSAIPSVVEGGGSVAVSPPSPPTAGERLTVVRTTDLTKQGNLHTQLVSQILNSLIRRGELTYTADDDVTRRWALDPTASPNWPTFPGGGLTGTFSSGTFGNG